MISVHEHRPSGGPINTVGKPALNVLRMLVKNDLEFDWKVDRIENTGTNLALVIKTDAGSAERTTVYLGPPDEMRLLLGAVGWYLAHKGDAPARSRLSTELFFSIGNKEIDAKALLEQLREQFEPFVSRVM